MCHFSGHLLETIFSLICPGLFEHFSSTHTHIYIFIHNRLKKMATHLSAHHPLRSVNIRTAAALGAHQPQVDSLTTSEKGTTTQRPNFVNG